MSSVDDVGASPESTSLDEGIPFKERPTTRTDGCHPEPLDDSVEDCYRLHEPIADAPSIVGDDRYLDGGEPMTALEAVGSYIERRHGENVSAEKHGFHKTRQWRRKRQYALGKEMDRQLLDAYENPTTALLSLRISPAERGRLTLLNGLHKAIDPIIKQLRYRLQKAPDAPLSSEEWEYFAVIAGTEERATPHLHILVYCDDDISRQRFAPVVEKFVEKCPFAPDDMRGNSPDSGTISLRGNGADEIPRMDGEPAESAGATYVLTQLPHLRDVDKMARDELLHSSTVDAWGGDAFRKSQYTVWDDEEQPSAEEVSGVEPTLSGESSADTLNETEHEFVKEYVAEVGVTNRETIRTSIEQNRDVFEREPNTEKIICSVMTEIQSEATAD
jgi:hypothetical protein